MMIGGGEHTADAASMTKKVEISQDWSLFAEIVGCRQPPGGQDALTGFSVEDEGA